MQNFLTTLVKALSLCAFVASQKSPSGKCQERAFETNYKSIT